MTATDLKLTGLRPYFAEIPYYLWGQISYDSEGDCKRPTDRNWTWIYLRHRDTGEEVSIKWTDDLCKIDANQAAASRLALFLRHRCSGIMDYRLADPISDWDHEAAQNRAAKVAHEFDQASLAPFDNHYFWGSWKWIGWYATELTWVSRWIMHSVVRNDPRAISLCIDWLKGPPRFAEQVTALCYAVERLSGEPSRTAKDWVAWYEGGSFREGARKRFPEPDFNAWLNELKAEFGEPN